MKAALSGRVHKMFTDIQYVFTSHIRDPETNPAPADIEDRRMGIYRDLFYRNVESFIANSFPVLRKVTPDEQWHEIIHDYFKNHQAHTPLFPKMPQEFLQYLEHERVNYPEDPPWLLELAHYEWIETAVSIDSRNIDFTDIDPEGDLIEGIPVLSPLALPVAYTWPVHKISPEYNPDVQPSEPTWIIIFRRQNDDVGFMVLNAVSARLIEKIQNNQSASGREILMQIAKEIQHTDPETVISGGLEIMKEMQAKDILLGVKKVLS
jgi:hypothetical protein